LTRANVVLLCSCAEVFRGNGHATAAAAGGCRRYIHQIQMRARRCNRQPPTANSLLCLSVCLSAIVIIDLHAQMIDDAFRPNALKIYGSNFWTFDLSAELTGLYLKCRKQAT